MPIFEVRIRGRISAKDDDGEDAIFEEEYVFTQVARDFVGAMMAVQPKLDCLNEALRTRVTPRPSCILEGDEFQIVGLAETELIQFTDKWIDQYLNHGVVNCEEAE